MGRDKSQLPLGDTTFARRLARELLDVVTTAVEVGPGVTDLPSTRELDPGSGPLAAIAAGVDALRSRGHRGAALVVACDLPFVTSAVLRLLARWDASGSVVPVVEGRVQPLCARWARRELDDARRRVASGERSLRHLADLPDVTLLHATQWGAVAEAATFVDVDTPDDLERWGLKVE